MIPFILAAALCTPLPTCTNPITVTPCDQPTGTIRWDKLADARVQGYEVYWDGPGSMALLADHPGQFRDHDGALLAAPFFPGASMDFPIQRDCPLCLEAHLYSFAVKAYILDASGNKIRSAAFSNTATWCPHHIWAKPEHYQ